MMRKLMAVLMSAALMISAAVPAYGLTNNDKSDYDKAARDFAEEIVKQNKNSDPFSYLSAKSSKKLSAEIKSDAPTKWDLTAEFMEDGDETKYVTPIKFQNPFGTCWGFAAIAAAESSIISSGLAAEDGYAAVEGDGMKELDLSERHLTYFVNEPIKDESNPQNGEGREFARPYTVPEKLNTGGALLYAGSLFASGMGPNREDRTDPDDGKSMYDLLAYGTDTWNIEKRSLDGGAPENFCYEKDTNDWSIPESKRFYQSYTLKDSALLPSPATENADGKYEYNEDGTNAIKAELLEGRAVTVSFHADSYLPSQDAGDGKYISKEWAHYTYDEGDEAGPNHGVTIVGWDDEYPKENFVKDHEPPENGAWLVKNSWGSGEREFPNKGTANWGIVSEKTGKHTGYFWLSYYDKSIGTLETFEFDKSNEGRTYHLDQHDYLPVAMINTVEQKDNIKMANVFKAEENQILDQITSTTTHPNTTVESKVYLLPNDFKDPEEGVLIATVSEKFALGGYHKTDVPAESKKVIQKGQYYSVVQTHELENGSNGIVIPVAVGKGAAEKVGLDGWYKGIINKNESFVYNEDKWLDYSGVFKDFVPEDAKEMYAFDNFPIKVYSEPVEDDKNLTLSVTQSFRLSSKGSKASDGMSLRFIGAKNVDVGDINISWNIITPDGAEIVEVTPGEKNRTTAALKGLKAGRALIEVKAGDLGSRIISVEVYDPALVILTGDIENPIVYTGKPIVPLLVGVDNMGTLIMQDTPDENVKFEYKNNVKCGVATATLVPVTDYYSAPISCQWKIIPQEGSVSKITAGKKGSKSLKVTVKNQKSSGVSKYQVQYKISGKSKWSSKTLNAKTNKITLSKLKKGKKYDIRVRAYAKNAGYGEYSKVKTSPKVK